MPKLRKIHGRPLLPWWVYIGYFLIAAAIVIWNHAAHGEEMQPATGKTAEKAKYGRRGDTRLAHLNPFEEAILKALGGSGTTNPKTGYKEYWTEAVGDAAGASPSDSGISEAGTGGVSIDRVGSRSFDPEAGSPFGPSGGNATTWDLGLDATKGLLGLGPQSQVTGPPTGIEGALNRNAQYAMMPMGMSLLARGANFVNDRFFGGNARADFPQNSPGGFRDDAIMNALGAQPVAAPPPAQYARPAEQMPPPSLGLAGGLTDLQRRSQIATGGAHGQSGVYRTPEAMRYYGQLIARALIGDNGQAQENSNILPVEKQYLGQVYGINNSDKAGTLLEALRPYWSR